MAELRRPGGELASRPLHFFWMVDCSGSMYGEKIGTVNNAIQTCIPEMASAAENNPNAQLLIRTLSFSTGATCGTTASTAIRAGSRSVCSSSSETPISETVGCSDNSCRTASCCSDTSDKSDFTSCFTSGDVSDH